MKSSEKAWVEVEIELNGEQLAGLHALARSTSLTGRVTMESAKRALVCAIDIFCSEGCVYSLTPSGR